MKSYKLFYIIICSFCTILSLKAQTQEEVQQHFEETLREYSQKIKSISCDFTQTRKMSILKEEDNVSGHFYYTRPSLMALIYKNGNLIKINDKNYLIKQEGKIIKGKTKRNPMMKQMNRIISACVSNEPKNIYEGFNIEIKESPKVFHLFLYPKKRAAKRYIKQISLSFDKANMSLNDMIIVEKKGDSTSYQFFNKTFNQELSQDIFQIK